MKLEKIKLEKISQETINQIKAWMKENKKAVAAAAGLVLMLGILVAGAVNQKPEGPALPEPVIMTATSADADRVEEPAVPSLDEDQKAILEDVVRLLEEDNLQEAAACILDHEQKLQYLFYQVMEGKRYLYKDGVLSEELEGKGLVLKKPLSVFYGTFQNGLPQGEGIALQGIYLEGMRYDYSHGLWEQGTMNGEGVVGYHYFQGSQGEENQAVQKEGNFVMDLMDGDITYRTTNSDGETTIWDMTASQGKTKLDARWVREEEKQDYYLPSNQNSSHTYVLPDSAVDEVRWRNMLLWEE